MKVWVSYCKHCGHENQRKTKAKGEMLVLCEECQKYYYIKPENWFEVEDFGGNY